MAQWSAALLVATSLVSGGPAAADERDKLHERTLAAGCAACHGTDGRAPAGSAVPGLAGRPHDELRDAMQAFRHGTRGGTVMPQIARGYDDAQIERLATFFASRLPHATP